MIHRWLRYVSKRDRHRLMNQCCFDFDDEIRFVYLTIYLCFCYVTNDKEG